MKRGRRLRTRPGYSTRSSSPRHSLLVSPARQAFCTRAAALLAPQLGLLHMRICAPLPRPLGSRSRFGCYVRMRTRKAENSSRRLARPRPGRSNGLCLVPWACAPIVHVALCVWRGRVRNCYWQALTVCGTWYRHFSRSPLILKALL